MAPKIPQKGDPNPKPQELTSEVKKECDDENRIRLRAANIKMFKAVVMKIADSAPNKRSLEKCIDQLCSNQRTPDHPPYATMIERAIGELSKKEGLDPIGEESISDFIRKEYNDLPWAHSKMLHIHLRKLRKSGSIIRTKSQHYLLAPPPPPPDCQKRKSRNDLEIPPGFETLENPSSQERRLEMKIRIPAVKPPSLSSSNFEESSGLTMKQAILDVQDKKKERRQKELNKFSRLLGMDTKHPPVKRASQNLSNRVSRPWLFSSPVPHGYPEQQQ